MCSLCAVVADYAGMSMASMQRAQSVVVYDGTIACVVACWLEGVCRASVGGERSSLWVAGALDVVSMRAAERLAETAQFAEIIQGQVPVASRGLEASAMLLSAGEATLARRSERLVWPIQLGGELYDDVRVSEGVMATDRALLTARLLSVDSTGPGLVIETPMLDLTDRQLIELAADIDAPVGLARWCPSQAQSGGRICGTCTGCRRWVPMLQHGGLVGQVAGIDAAVLDSWAGSSAGR
jgi:hypothetical protein